MGVDFLTDRYIFRGAKGDTYCRTAPELSSCRPLRKDQTGLKPRGYANNPISRAISGVFPLDRNPPLGYGGMDCRQ